MMVARITSPVLAIATLLFIGACDDSTSPPAPATGTDPGPGEERASLWEPLPSHCPEGTRRRSAEEVLEDHRAALAAGDLDAVYCNYARDATVISDGGIDVGHEAIRASLEFFLQIFGGVQPVVVQEVPVEIPSGRTEMVRVLFTVDTPCVIVPDGVDTYVIRSGQIHGQTSHALPVFTCF